MGFIYKILDKLNIHLDDNQKWIALSYFIVGTISAYTNPTFIKEYGMNLPAQFFAVEAIVCAFSSLLVGMIWQGKVRECAVKWFIHIAAFESIVAFLVGMWLVFVSYNIWVLAVSCVIYGNLISVFVGKCIMAFRTKIWNEEAREVYDNNNSIIGSIVCLLGYGTSLFCLPSVKTAVFLWGTICLFDNIAWCFLYHKHRNKFIELFSV